MKQRLDLVSFQLCQLDSKMMSLKANKAILLINLGSPQSPTRPSIRRYLRQFLSDRRVMTMPAPLRWMIVNLVIAPFRPSVIKSSYQSIWSDQGFPLIVHAEKLAAGVLTLLDESFLVEIGMRYGQPDLNKTLEKIRLAGVQQLLIFPLFPQYSSATTGSIIEQCMNIIRSWNVIPEVTFISSFYRHPKFIEAWRQRGESYIQQQPDHILFSFHGLPESHILEGDVTSKHCLKSASCCFSENAVNGCYRAQCFKTAELIAEALSLDSSNYSISFQSRLGKAKWLEPYTNQYVKQLAEKGVKNLLVFCPSFVADCLETTHEIQAEVKEEFLKCGGKNLTLVPSLNSSQTWIQMLASIIKEKLKIVA